MAKTYPKKQCPSPSQELHRELLDCLVRAGELILEWKLVQRTTVNDPLLPRAQRLTIMLVASRAQSKCVAIADTVLAGMVALVRSDYQKVTKLLQSCRGHMAFLEAVDDTVAGIVRKSITHNGHGH
jgi:hypothetical protein